MMGEIEYVDDVATAFADLVVRDAPRTIALSGGDTARRCYELLASRSGIDWPSVTVLFGDERVVPVSDAESNEGMARTELLDHVPVGEIHSLVNSGAEPYEKLLEQLATIDLVHLGMGPDGHTASLFPGTSALDVTDQLVVQTGDTNHPHPSGKPVSQLLAEACEKGGSTFYGTGMNPGVNQILGVVCSADVAEIENVTTIESVDVSCHHSKDTWIEVGYGLPVDDPSIPAKLEKYTRVFADSVLMMADCFGLELDEVTFSYELGACTKDVDLGWYVLPKGSLGGNYIKYQGMVDGVPRVETHLEWQMTPHTDPSWDIKGCYITQIKGDPCVYNKHMIFPKPGVDLSDPANFASIGMTVTGMPALHAIKSVIAAPPGLLTSADLPLRGFAGRFKS